MQTFNNFISNDKQQEIEDTLMSRFYPWFWQGETVHHGSSGCVFDDKVQESLQLHHAYIVDGKLNSNYAQIVFDLVFELEKKTGKQYGIFVAKSNMLLRESNYPNDKYHTPHIDLDQDGTIKSLLYYVNDSDGETIFFNERGSKDNTPNIIKIDKKVMPKKGTAILFDSDILHCSTPPTFNDRRVVINIVMGELNT